MEEKLLAPLVEEEEERIQQAMTGRKVTVYGISEYVIKELYLFKNLVNVKRMFLPKEEDLARIWIRVYLLSNMALDKLGYKE